MSHKNKFSLSTIVSLVLVGLTTVSGIVLSSSNSFAANSDEVKDKVTLSVPMICTLQGSGMNSHTASVPNGTYNLEVGTTTIKAYCNDSDGFAIYAIGFTDNEYGNNKLIGENTGEEIETGSDTVGDFGISNWSMKLATDSSADYPLEIEPGFDDYIEVPPVYELVASRESSTDIGSYATGASLTTTYAIYIDKTQVADTYNGQVKYTLVHPVSANTPLPPTEVSVDIEISEEGYELGDDIEYTITVTNTGEYDAENLVVTIDGQEEWEIPFLAAGDSEEMVTEQTVQENHIIAGAATLVVQVTGENIETVVEDITSEVADPNPSVSINLDQISSSEVDVEIENDGNISFVEYTVTIYGRSSPSDPWHMTDTIVYTDLGPGKKGDKNTYDVDPYYKVNVRAKTALNTYIEEEAP